MGSLTHSFQNDCCEGVTVLLEKLLSQTEVHRFRGGNSGQTSDIFRAIPRAISFVFAKDNLSEQYYPLEHLSGIVCY